MSTLVRTSLMGGLAGMRHEPTAKRIRATLDGRTVVDTTRAVLVWEPRRVVPSWAVPADDIVAELIARIPATGDAGDIGLDLPDVSQRPVLDPSIPFAVHTAAGQVLDVVCGNERRAAAGLRLADEDLTGYVVLDFDAFDEWWEEDELNIGHPRDPFHRIDVLASSRHVRFELDGDLLAESTRPHLLFETMLPVRFYLPRDDVRADFHSTTTRSTCAYKGYASYLSPVVHGQQIADLAWTYEQPLREAAQIAGLIAFFDERIDVVVDGVKRERPITPWSRPAS